MALQTTFQMHLPREILCILFLISLLLDPKGLIGKNSTLVYIGLAPISNKPLPEPMVTKLTDAYMRYLAMAIEIKYDISWQNNHDQSHPL